MEIYIRILIRIFPFYNLEISLCISQIIDFIHNYLFDKNKINNIFIWFLIYSDENKIVQLKREIKNIINFLFN